MGKLERLSAASPNSTRIIQYICVIYFAYIFIIGEGLLQMQQQKQQFPQSGTCTSRIKLRSRTDTLLNVKDYGATGNGFTDDTKAVEAVWKIACSLSSGPKIVIPAGYSLLVRPIHLSGPCQSKITIRIHGSIVASKNPDVWEDHNRHKWIYFIGVNNLFIEGGGIVNGMGEEWWAQSCKVNTTNPCRPAPTAMTFHRCENVRIRNLVMINSQKMHMAFTNCALVVASHLRVLAPAASPNTDGIHISESTHVEVKNSLIRTGDDCISIVSNSSRIRVRNIACGPGHGISIGSLGESNSWTKVHDVKVDGAFLSNTENGLRIKTWQGGSGSASQITFRDVWMENVSNPIIIDQYYCDKQLPCRNQTSALRIMNISYIRIKGTSATEEAIKFACSDNYPCQNLYLEDIQLVSNTEGITKSFCWQAKGSSSEMERTNLPLKTGFSYSIQSFFWKLPWSHEQMENKSCLSHKGTK